MTATGELNDQVECDWRYTCESLKKDYDAAIERMKKNGPIKEEDSIVIAMGHALDLVEIAGDMPKNPINLDLVPPTHEDGMMEIMGFAALLFQDRGSDAVRTKLAKMLASYELFVTMNALIACKIEVEYQVDESSIILRAIDSSGQELKFNFLNRAKFAMSRCVIPDRGEMPNAAITLAPFYRKLREDFVLPLLANEDDENGRSDLPTA